jgi:hypothetical protein
MGQEIGWHSMRWLALGSHFRICHMLLLSIEDGTNTEFDSESFRTTRVDVDFRTF